MAEKRIAVFKGPLHVHPLWLHKDERVASLVLIVLLALLVYFLLEHLVRQMQRRPTGWTPLDLFAAYAVAHLQFTDGSGLWTCPKLTSAQFDASKDLGFPLSQTILIL